MREHFRILRWARLMGLVTLVVLAVGGFLLRLPTPVVMRPAPHIIASRWFAMLPRYGTLMPTSAGREFPKSRLMNSNHQQRHYSRAPAHTVTPFPGTRLPHQLRSLTPSTNSHPLHHWSTLSRPGTVHVRRHRRMHTPPCIPILLFQMVSSPLWLGAMSAEIVHLGSCARYSDGVLSLLELPMRVPRGVPVSRIMSVPCCRLHTMARCIER